MKSIKGKIIAAVIICALISAGVCGVISVVYSGRNAYSNSKQDMIDQCGVGGSELNSMMERTAQSVDILYSLALSSLDDPQKFKTDKAYVDSYTEKMSGLLLNFANNTDGALTAYIRYNPEFTEPTSGVFYSRSDDESEFESLTPTDFTMYSPDDLEHVGWYYIPVENKEATWMAPYLNANINVTMISYVIPIYIDGESFGIIGMDINFNKFTDLVDEAKIFDSGYSFLADKDGNIVYHKDADMGVSISEMGNGMDSVAEFVKSGKDGDIFEYKYNGKAKEMCSVSLVNGMKYILTSPESELRSQTAKMARMILLGALAALVIAAVIGILMGIAITGPIGRISRIVNTTADFDFSERKEDEKIYRLTDESGQMAKSLKEMRNKLGTMVEDIKKVCADLQNTTDHITETTKQVSAMSSENADTSQNLAAAMEETAATMDNINHKVSNIKERAGDIRNRANMSMESSDESKKRADALKDTTDEAEKRTTRMYENVQGKAETAMEQAKAVDKINQLTQAILDISSQTNLLALNASIEAARAGEAGRGFAVVADEIGTLASQTSTTASSINSIIDEVHQAFNNMVSCLKESMEFLEKTVLKDYDGFTKVAGQYTEDATNFESEMSGVNDDVELLLNEIVGIASAVDDISRTVDEAANGVTQMAGKTVDVTKAMESSAALMEGNRENVVRLKNIIDVFKDV